MAKFRKKPVVIEAERTLHRQVIQTLEGAMVANAGDWIVTGVKGERYPVKPDIFDATYAPADATYEPVDFEAVDFVAPAAGELGWLGLRLLEILQSHCGERGEAEGAVETLERIIRERDAARERIAPDEIDDIVGS